MHKQLIIFSILLSPLSTMADSSDTVMAKYKSQIEQAVKSGNQPKAAELGRAVMIENAAILTAKREAENAAAKAFSAAQ